MDALDKTLDVGPGDAAGPYAKPANATGPELGRIDLAREAPLRLGALGVEPALRRVANDDGREAILEPRVMQVLVALIRAGGRIVSRDELAASCWHGVVVGEDALNRVIGRLRRMLDEVGGAARVETITKVGYRLVPSAQSATLAAPAADERKLSICVLPFTNMSDDPEQAYFSDGVCEDIITDLSKVSSLFVVARTSAFSFRGSALDIPEVARQLRVGHVLEGSVRKADGRVRITAQLIDGATGGHVWAERYDRDLKDIFALQDEISQAIVGALKLRLLPEEKQAIEHRGTSDPEAYSLYLLARRYFLTTREGQRPGLEAIERLCLRATEIDPNYAEAWALMAVAQTAMHHTHGRPRDSGLAAVERALALNPDLAEAHAVKARHLTQQGEIEAAGAEIAEALRLDPESWAANSTAGMLNYEQRRFEAAIGYWEKAITLSDSSCGDPGMLMSSYAAIGNAEGVQRAAKMALTWAEAAMAGGFVNGSAMGCGVGALAAMGQVARARAMMDRGLMIDPDNAMMRYNFACGMSAYLNDADTALDLLGPVFAELGEKMLAHAKLDPDLDPIRDDPRFEALVAAAEKRLMAAADRPTDPAS
jgi:adenylate cyclase